MKKIYFALGLSLIIAFIIFNKATAVTNAKDFKSTSQKYYTSVQIENGDTLWSISKKYKPDGISTKEYVEDLKSMNSLASDNIDSGKYLTIYYYKD